MLCYCVCIGEDRTCSSPHQEARDAHGIQCMLGASMRLGEPDGRLKARLSSIAVVMREAGIKLKLTRGDYSLAVGSLCRGGSFSCWSMLGQIVASLGERRTHPEGHAIGRARGIQLWRILDETLPFLLPAWLFVPLMKRFLRTEVARLGLEGHSDGHADDEISAMYENVLCECERLGVKMPHLRGFHRAFLHHKQECGRA